MEDSVMKKGMQVSLVSIVVNMVLALFKLLAGIIASSGAMISDAIHSASDVFSTIIVMVGLKLAAKKSDREHPYGHERLECTAAILLAGVLAMTGLLLGYGAVKDLWSGAAGAVPVPGILALIAAVVSILVKECLFQYTKKYAKALNSSALMADAWHHRSDALSSIGALVGIAAARLGFLQGDAIASIVICLMILKAAYDIFKDAIDKMVDKSCDDAFEAQLRDFILGQEGVHGIGMLHTRLFGNRVYVDLEITIPGETSLNQAHAVAEQVHHAIESTFPTVKHIMIHTEPC